MNGSCFKNGKLLRSQLISILFIVAMVLLATLIFCLLALQDSQGIGNGKLKLIIDNDGGADDAMAIFMALLNEKYYNGPEVIALTSVHGNVPENQTFINIQKILNAVDRRDVKIYRGASHALLNNSVVSDFYFGRDGLGDLEPVSFNQIKDQNEIAANALIDYSKEYQDNLVVFSLGTLTNIALAVRLDPEFIGRLGHLYIAAGNIYDEKYAEQEFNIQMDVEAYKIVTDEALADRVTVIPFSTAMECLNITNDWRINTLGAIPTPLVRLQNQWERISLQTTPYWSQLDPAAISVLLDPGVVTEKRCSHNSVVLNGSARGITTNDFDDVEKYNVYIITKMDEDVYKNLLYKLFSAELNVGPRRSKPTYLSDNQN